MTADFNIVFIVSMTCVFAICVMYARVCFARMVLGGHYRVSYADKSQRWALRVLFPKRPSGVEPRVIAPGTHLALYRVGGIYYYRELAQIYPMWDGKRVYTCGRDLPAVLDFTPDSIEDYCEQDLTLLTAGKSTRVTVTQDTITLHVDNVEEIRILR